MHHVCMLAICSGMTNVLTNEGLFNIDLNPMYRPMAADALSDATLKQIESDIVADNAEKKPAYPHLVYCPRLTNSADTLPVDLRPTGDLGILYDKASANTPMQHHIDVTEMFSLVVNSGTADDYNEAATRYRQMFGETAKSNNAGFFVFHGGFQSHSGWQKRYQGPAFNFLDAFETGRVVPAMHDDWVRDWLIFWLRFNRVVMTEVEAEEALTHVSVSHSASICWSLLLQGRQETVVPNMVPNALEAEPLPADTPQATVWQEKCVYKCAPKAKIDGTCTSDVNCKAKCLAEPKCKGYYLTQGCTELNTCGALVNSAPRDNELANAQDSGFGTFDLFYAKELYEVNGGAGIAFHELGTFPVGKRVVQTHVYKKKECDSTTPVAEGTPYTTLTECEHAGADRCVKTSGAEVRGVAHNETVASCAAVHERISRNVPSACRATCLDTDTCLSWTWDTGTCTHYTGVGELTTSSVVPDLGMLQELGMNVSHACNKEDEVYDMCVQQCVHIRNKLHHGWCNNKWVNCKAGKFAEAQTDIPALDKGKSVCTGGFHPEDSKLLASNIVQYRTGRASPLTYRAYDNVKLPLNYGDESDRAPVLFGGREGAYTATRCGDIGAYIMDTGNVTFKAWQEFSRGELHTNVEGRMSKLVEDSTAHQHRWPTHTFVSMGQGSRSTMDGNAYASPLAGTSSKPADGINPITFPKCQSSGSGRLYSFTRGNQCVNRLNANMRAYYEKSLAFAGSSTLAGTPFYGTTIAPGPASTDSFVLNPGPSGLITRDTTADASKKLICFRPEVRMHRSWTAEKWLTSGHRRRFTGDTANRFIPGAHAVLIDSHTSEQCTYHQTQHALVTNVEFERAYGDNEDCYTTMDDMKDYYSSAADTDYTSSTLRQFPRGVGCKPDLGPAATELLNGFEPFFTRVMIDRRIVPECSFYYSYDEALYANNVVSYLSFVDGTPASGSRDDNQCARGTPMRENATRFMASACAEGPRQFFSKVENLPAGDTANPKNLFPPCCKLFHIDNHCNARFYTVSSHTDGDMGLPIGQKTHRAGYIGHGGTAHTTLEGWPYAENAAFPIIASWFRIYKGFAQDEPALNMCPGMTVHSEWTDAEYAFAAVHPTNNEGDCQPHEDAPGTDVYMVHNQAMRSSTKRNDHDYETIPRTGTSYYLSAIPDSTLYTKWCAAVNDQCECHGVVYYGSTDKVRIRHPSFSMNVHDKHKCNDAGAGNHVPEGVWEHWSCYCLEMTDMYFKGSYAYGMPVHENKKFREIAHHQGAANDQFAADALTYQQQCWQECKLHCNKFGDHRVKGGGDVVENIAFTPEVRFQGRWYPICGLYFWDNDNGATAICKDHGFSVGKIVGKSTPTTPPGDADRFTFDTDGKYVGTCLNSDTKLELCESANWEKPSVSGRDCSEGLKLGFTIKCSGAKTVSACAKKYCVHSGARFYNEVATMGEPTCHIRETCEKELSASTTVASFLQATTTGTGELLAEEAALQDLVDKKAMMPTSLAHMHPPTPGYIQNAQRAFADGGTREQATTYYPPPAERYRAPYDLGCTLDYEKGHEYPLKLLKSGGNTGISWNSYSAANFESCKNAVRTHCENKPSDDCRYVWYTGTNCYAGVGNIAGMYRPSSEGTGQMYQFGCEDKPDHLPEAWTIPGNGVGEVHRNPTQTVDGTEWKRYVATVPRDNVQRYPSKHLPTATSMGFSHDVNVANAGFMCPAGVYVGGNRHKTLKNIKEDVVDKVNWHPLAQTTLMCPHNKPVRCSKLVVIEVAGGTCEYSSETGKQQHPWSGATAQTIEPGNENMENWKSKLGQNAPCHRYDFACHSITDDEKTEVCGRNSTVETALGGARCGTDSTGGFCGVNAADGTTVDSAAAHCDQWPTGDRKVCPDGFAYFHKKGASRATCVPARAAHKNHGVLRKHLAPTLVMETGDKDGQHYTMSSCKDVQVATADGRCIDKDCAERKSKELCESQDVIPGAKSCAWSSSTLLCTAPTPTPSTTREHWWPGFVQKKGAFSGVGPAYVKAFEKCDDTSSTKCKGFDKCGNYTSPVADCASEANIKTKCCARAGVSIDVAKAGVCEASPSTKCAGGKFMYNTEDSQEDAPSIIPPAPTGSKCPTTHPWVAHRHTGSSITGVGKYCCRAKPTPAGTPLGSILECLKNAYVDCPSSTTACTHGFVGGAQICSCNQDKCEAGTNVENATVALKLNISLDTGYTADLEELFLVLVDSGTGASVRAEGCTGPQSRLEGGEFGACACQPAEKTETVSVSSGPVYLGDTAADCLGDVDCIGTASDKMLYTHAGAGRAYNTNGHAPYQSYPSRNRPYRCNYYETCAPDKPFPGEIAFTKIGTCDISHVLVDCQSFEAVHRAQHWCVGLGDSCAYLAKDADGKYCALPDLPPDSGTTYTVYQKHTAHDLYDYTHGTSAVNLDPKPTLTMFDANAAAVCSADEECAAYSVVGDKLYIYKTGGSSAPGSVYLKGKKLLARAPCPPLQPCAHGTNVRQGDKCVCRCDDFFAGPLCDRCSSANRDETCRACKDNFMPGQNDVCICQPGFDISTGCTTCKSGFEGVFCQTNTCAVTMQETVGPLSYTLKNVAIAYDAAGQLYDGVIGAGDGRVPYSMQNTFVKVHGKMWFLYASPTAARVEVTDAADLPTDTVHNISGGEWLYSIPEKSGTTTVADIVADEDTWGYVCTLGTGGNAPTDTVDAPACATTCNTTTCGSWHWNNGTCTTYQRDSKSEYTASEHNIDTRNCRSGGVRLAGKYRNLPARPPLAVPDATRMLQKVPDNMLWTVVCAYGNRTAKFILSEYRRHPWTGGPCEQQVQLTWLYSLPRGAAMDVTTPHYHGLARAAAVQTTVNAPNAAACAAECKSDPSTCEVWTYNGGACSLTVSSVSWSKAYTGYCYLDTEIQMFKGDGDNKGTDIASRVWECGNACLTRKDPVDDSRTWASMDEVGVLGFVVKAENGKCFCESGNSATCQRSTASSGWARYDFNPTACVSGLLPDTVTYPSLSSRIVDAWGGALTPAAVSYYDFKPDVVSWSYAGDGKCSGDTEIQMFDGDNPGTDPASRVLACGNACLNRATPSNSMTWSTMDEVGVLGFVVKATTGRCYCESANSASATCSRVHMEYTRYDFNPITACVPYLLPDKSAALPDVATSISTVSNYRECCYACAGSASWQMAGARCSCYDGGKVNGDVGECYVPTKPAPGQECNVAITMANKGAFKPDRVNGACFNLLAVTNYVEPEDCSALCLDEEECDAAHHTSAAVCTLLQCARPDLAKGDVDTGATLYIKAGACLEQPNGMCHYRPRRAGHTSGACSANGASVAYQADVRLYYNDDNEGNSVPVLGGQGCSATSGVNRAAAIVAEIGKLEPALPSPPGILLQTADTNLLMHRFDPGVYPSTTGFEYTDSPENGPTQAVAAITRDMRLPTLNVAGRRRRTVPNALGVAPNQAATFQITQSIAVPLENAACHEQARLATVMAGLKSPSMEQGRCSGTNAKDLAACTRVKHYTSALETIQAAYVQQLASCHAEAVGMDYASPLQLMMYVQPRAGLERIEYHGLPAYYAPRSVHDTAGLPRIDAMAMGSDLAPAVAGTPEPTPPVFETPSPTPSRHADKPNIKCTAQEHCCFAEQLEHKTSPAWHAEEKVLEIIVDTEHMAGTGPECMALCARFLLCRVAEWKDGVCHMWSLPIKLAHLQHNETFWVTPPETDCAPSASITAVGIIDDSPDDTVYVKQDCCLRHMLH